MKIVAFPHIDVLHSPIGLLVIKATANLIHEIYFDDDFTSPIRPTQLTLEAKQQLNSFFEGNRTSFSLPLHMEGTAFQQNVWEKLQTIPFGKTWSYLDLAVTINDEHSVRAVASANAKNKFAIVVPCHRVIGTDGKLTGYAWGLKRKRWLLDFEQQVTGQKLALF